MFLRKSVFLATAMAIMSLPMITHADLKTINKTDEFSVAKVDYTGFCSGTFKNKITPPHQSLTTTTGDVRTLCGNHAPCSATIIMSKTEDAARQCKGTTVAKAEIQDLNTDYVTSVDTLNKAYTISVNAKAKNEVTISKN